MEEILFFDTETTGVPRDYKAPVTDTDNWPRLVQIGWIVTSKEGKVIKQSNYIIKPIGFVIPSEASNVHGITTESALTEGVDLKGVLEEFMCDVNNACRIVGHNISFDQNIIGAELCRLKMTFAPIFTKPVTCTMKATIDFCQLGPVRYGSYKWPKLDELHRKLFERGFDNAHDAMADITATKDCYFELIRRHIIEK